MQIILYNVICLSWNKYFLDWLYGISFKTVLQKLLRRYYRHFQLGYRIGYRLCLTVAPVGGSRGAARRAGPARCTSPCVIFDLQMYLFKLVATLYLIAVFLPLKGASPLTWFSLSPSAEAKPSHAAWPCCSRRREAKRESRRLTWLLG